MSWKSLVTVGLFCILASPALAQGPTLSDAKGGSQANNYLNANGDWVWTIKITPDMGIVTGGAASGTPQPRSGR